MAATYANLLDVLKEDYQPALREQLNQEFFILAQVEKNTTQFEGRRAVHAIHVTRNSGIGNRGDGGTLPSAGNQGYKQVKIPVRRIYGVGKVSRSLMKAMKSDRGSFVRALTSEMDGLKRDAARDVNRQIWGTSDGVIAACGATSASTTLQLATTTTETQILQAFADGGMKIDVGTVASPTSEYTGLTVSGYDLTNKTITVSSAVTTTTSHRIFRTGNGGASDDSGDEDDGQLELTGLQDIVDDTSVLHTLDPASVLSWASYESGNSGTNRNWTESGAVSVAQNVEKRSGKQVDLIVSGDGVWRAVQAFYAQRNRTLDPVEMKGGYFGVRFGAAGEMRRPNQSPKAMAWERDCPENRQFFLSSECLVEHRLTDWEFVDEDGDVLSRSATTDDFEFRLASYRELGCTQRNAHGVYEDLNQAS